MNTESQKKQPETAESKNVIIRLRTSSKDCLDDIADSLEGINQNIRLSQYSHCHKHVSYNKILSICIFIISIIAIPVSITAIFTYPILSILKTLIIVVLIISFAVLISVLVCIPDYIYKLKKTIENQKKTIENQEGEIRTLKFITLPPMMSSSNQGTDKRI